jgi:hypothetical protein
VGENHVIKEFRKGKIGYWLWRHSSGKRRHSKINTEPIGTVQVFDCIRFLLGYVNGRYIAVSIGILTSVRWQYSLSQDCCK